MISIRFQLDVEAAPSWTSPLAALPDGIVTSVKLGHTGDMARGDKPKKEKKKPKKK
jgi:hypothetical protein